MNESYTLVDNVDYRKISNEPCDVLVINDCNERSVIEFDKNSCLFNEVHIMCDIGLIDFTPFYDRNLRVSVMGAWEVNFIFDRMLQTEFNIYDDEDRSALFTLATYHGYTSAYFNYDDYFHTHTGTLLIKYAKSRLVRFIESVVTKINFKRKFK